MDYTVIIFSLFAFVMIIVLGSIVYYIAKAHSITKQDTAHLSLVQDVQELVKKKKE